MSHISLAVKEYPRVCHNLLFLFNLFLSNLTINCTKLDCTVILQGNCSPIPKLYLSLPYCCYLTYS
jgi:hypothetical protein